MRPDRASTPLGAPLAAGALVVTGLTMALIPQHAGSIARLAVAAVAVAALSLPLHRAARRNTAPMLSVFERVGWRTSVDYGVPGLESLRRSLATTEPVSDMPLPWNIRRQLATIVVTAVERHGLDPNDPAHYRRLSATTWSLFHHEGGRRLDGTRRQVYRVTPANSARLVHQVLDEISRLDSSPARQFKKVQGAR